MFGADIPAESQISFYDDYTAFFLGSDTEIQGYCCNGNFARKTSQGISTTLYLSGKLRSFFPCDDVEINGILCLSSPFAGVKLFENGKIKECKLAADQEVEGIQYKKKTVLFFDETGAVISSK